MSHSVLTHNPTQLALCAGLAIAAIGMVVWAKWCDRAERRATAMRVARQRHPSGRALRDGRTTIYHLPQADDWTPLSTRPGSPRYRSTGGRS